MTLHSKLHSPLLSHDSVPIRLLTHFSTLETLLTHPRPNAQVQRQIDNAKKVVEDVRIGFFGGGYQAHLKTLSTLSQLLTTALQLRADINLQAHKYTAHQLALLYQATTPLPALHAFQPHIQKHFESVKSVTSSGGSLNEEQKTWLYDMTTNMIQQVLYAGDKGGMLVPPAIKEVFDSAAAGFY
ncbi:hypothetical protein SpCBS45565_g07962 [Spizellomyces sp. 'palustris']|nr:hypothetical protein SpCBS45565_g07962 [Spizellomyces sp. 'palustris']